MRVNEKIEKITEDTIICGIDVGKTNCCARFCNYRGLEVYKKVWFDTDLRSSCETSRT